MTTVSDSPITSESRSEIGLSEETEQYHHQRIYLVTDGLKSPYTKQVYRLAFNLFLKTIGSSNSNNISDLRTLLDYKPSVIESKIIDYIEYLKTQGLSFSTIQVRSSAILHFFDINDVNLSRRKIKRFMPQDESDDYYHMDRPYSIDEIERIRDKCDIRSRVIILLMASTGMRIGGLRELRFGDIKKIDEFGLYMIWVYNRSPANALKQYVFNLICFLP